MPKESELPFAPLLHVADVAKLLNVAERTVRDYTDAGYLPSVDVNAGSGGRSRKTLRWRAQDVEQFVEDRLRKKAS